MRDVMSDSGNVVLMEKGTQVVGEYRGNVRRGSKRLFVLWTRAKTPTGVIAALASPATDALGRAGFDGDIDTHFWERFGSALLLSIVSDASSIGRQQLQDSSIQINNTTGATNTAAGIAVEQSINIPPTLNKNQGELVNIFVARDVDFSSVYQLRRIETRTQILDRTIPGRHRGAGCGDKMSDGCLDRTRWRPPRAGALPGAAGAISGGQHPDRNRRQPSRRDFRGRT